MSPARVVQMRMAAIRPATLDALLGEDDSILTTNGFEEKTMTKMLQEMVMTLGGARSHHLALPIWPGRLLGKDTGSGVEVCGRAGAGSADLEHCPQ